MSIIQTKWSEEQCPIEYGIFFSNDECILLEGQPEDGYAASARVLVSSLTEVDEDDGWVHLYRNPSCQIEENGFIVLGGETSWEGDGFVAVIEAASRSLVWIMHLYRSEKFLEINLDAENIQAVSAEYPHSYHWKIPLSKPEMLKVVC